VLFLAMIFLLLLAIISGTVIRTSILEFQMAGNDQFREEAFQRAEAIAANLSEDIDNFPVTGEVGYTLCDSASSCDDNNLVPDANVADVPTGVNVNYRIQRQGPLLIESLPFRQADTGASSSQVFDAAIFEASATVDGRSARLGSAQVVQGIAVRVASSNQ
jgi:Tfp pilus assembly protein PilX